MDSDDFTDKEMIENNDDLNDIVLDDSIQEGTIEDDAIEDKPPDGPRHLDDPGI